MILKKKKTKNKRQKQSIKYYKLLRKAETIAEEVLEKVKTYQDDLKAAAFKRKTKQFIEAIHKDKKSLNSILIDVFAVSFLAIKEVYGIKLHKVQIMGAYALHHGDVAEMKTGEGKTLTAVLPAYLNALTKKGVHIVTVNEYLSTRDAYNIGKIFNLLGLSVGSVVKDQTPEEKRKEYAKDLVYLTNAELGFDYLRDNMVMNLKDKIQREFNYAIVDEVDSILIDEARTPLIISGGVNVTEKNYHEINQFVISLKEEDYIVDRETRQAFLTESGVLKAEEHFNTKNLYSYKNSLLVHLIFNSIQANYIYKLDVDYTVKEDQIILIDVFTGRLLPGRQFSEGLNQAIEAKENVTINPETKTLASITYQNLFRMYKKLSGMSGTALTEEEEFLDIYNMRVLTIPTDLPIIRDDRPDVIYATKEAKINGIINKIISIHKAKQPILIGTRSVNESEDLGEILEKKGYSFEILNAKNHSREADIIANAGQLGSITISTNMAGRGTDIKLGKGVKDLGGLFVLGTERNEARRIDDQLRGRSGRQGDVGVSQFYLSMDDEVMQRSGMKKFQKFLKSIDKDPLESKSIARAIKSAQKKLEGLNYDYRKSIVEYDAVLNYQRIITYNQRDAILKATDFTKFIDQLLDSFLKNLSKSEVVFSKNTFSSKLYFAKLNHDFNLNLEEEDNLSIEKTEIISREILLKKLSEKINNFIELNKFDVIDYIRKIFLFSIDTNWQKQLDQLDRLKSGIRYRQYAQKNPVQIYIQEADKLFNLYRAEINEQVITMLLNTNPLSDNNSKNRNERTKELLVN
ncbi:preprotein translocase subunit SecA [Candidatus Hepatoplasma crinochetorum]|uniref:preprotein translocase subunit SecA n=1 Tax=Candidatus Hepatoplasma crinochetorum TaxID=295596 RepID=UPI00308E322C|nr:MAG: protein translocase subunit SecA [Candidatus Hepatoplasma crinochetorum]